MKPITFEDARGKLPGYESRQIILSESASGKELAIVSRIVGWLDELIFTSNIWVTSPRGTEVFPLKDFNLAVRYYTDKA